MNLIYSLANLVIKQDTKELLTQEELLAQSY